MTDYTLEDLVESVPSESSSTAAAETSSSGDGGKWIADMIEKLDDRGYLAPLIFGPEAAEGALPAPDGREPAEEAPAAQGGPQSPQIDAQSVKQMLLRLYDSSDKIPGLSDDPTVSELVRIIDAQPELADRLIAAQLGGAGGGDGGA